MGTTVGGVSVYNNKVYVMQSHSRNIRILNRDTGNYMQTITCVESE